MSEIIVRPIEGYKYEVAKDWLRVTFIKGYEKQLVGRDGTIFASLDNEGVLHIRRGYLSDGTSFALLNTKNSLRGAILHDTLCQFVREGMLPESLGEQIDAEARSVWFETMSATRAHAQYRGLRIARAFGADFCKRRVNDQEQQEQLIAA